MTDIKKGDRVKVTIEGEVTWVGKADPTCFEIGEHYFAGGNRASKYTPTPAIEKIEPPVEVFKPGDVVRTKEEPGTAYYYLAENGYVRLVTSDYTNATPFYEYGEDDTFTSKEYEKVDLSAVTG